VTKKRKSVDAAPAIDDNWRARSDMRTLAEAEEIKMAKDRHKAAQAEAHKEATRLSRVANHAQAKPQRGQRASRNHLAKRYI
jgi:hypothetical protein